jgi:hypothetical protein
MVYNFISIIGIVGTTKNASSIILSYIFFHYGPVLIEVDIGGHPPFPAGSKHFSGNFDNLLFLAGFNFRGHFEGLNEGF